jgi:hypothetical protein
MAASTKLVTPHQSSTGIVQLTPATRVKVEHLEELITIPAMTQTETLQ